MKTAIFKPVNEPAKPVQLFRGYSGEFEQGLVLFFALILERTAGQQVTADRVSQRKRARKRFFCGGI